MTNEPFRTTSTTTPSHLDVHTVTVTPGPAPVAVGDRVLYTLTDHEALSLKAAHSGSNVNSPHAGQAYPAVVTAVWSAECANLRVMLDGAGHGTDYWATSRTRGDQPGQWQFYGGH